MRVHQFVNRLKKLFGFEQRYAKNQDMSFRFRPVVEQMETRVVLSAPGAVSSGIVATVAEDGPTQTFSLFGQDNNAAPAALSFTIASLPEWGTLLHAGVPIFAGQTITADAFATPISTLNLVYVPGGNETGHVPALDPFNYFVTASTAENSTVTTPIVNIGGFTHAAPSIVRGTNGTVGTLGSPPGALNPPGVAYMDDKAVLYITLTDLNDNVTITMTKVGAVDNFHIVRTTTGLPGTFITDFPVHDVFNVLPDITELRIFARNGNDMVNAAGVNLNNVAPVPASSVKVTIIGGDGDDRLTGSTTNNNVLAGGDGNDTLIGGNNTLAASVDFISGGDGNDTITGNAGDDILIGGDGNDSINGNDGIDRIFGGAGLDSVNGGNQDDFFFVQGTEAEFDNMNGGGGSDTMVIIPAVIPVPLVLNSFTTANSIEVVSGNGQAIQGNASANVLNFSFTSHNGVTSVSGMAGNDIITGTARADVIFGNAGTDSINGFGSTAAGAFPTGYDVLDGGAGSDTLTGGSATGGAIFVVDALTDTVGEDVITDWTNVGGTPDKIRLVNFHLQAGAANPPNPVNPAPNYIVAPPPSPIPVTGTPYTIYGTTNGFGDALLTLPSVPTGSAAAGKRIKVKATSAASLTLADFDLVS